MQQPAGRRGPWSIVGIAAAGAFTILTALVVSTGLLPFDVPIADAVRGIGLPPDVWAFLTELGGGFVLIPAGVALGVAALATGRYRLTLVVAVVLLGGVVLTEALKLAVARPRPPWEHLVEASGFSFPSGHSLNSAATYGLLAVVTRRSAWVPSMARGVATAAGLALPFAIGLSRIALGVHYPSDVLGGWLAGTALVAAGAVLIDGLRAMVPRAAGLRAVAGS